MSTGTGIEWTDATWNPVVGCSRVHAGCDHCYAVPQSWRLERMGQEKYRGLTVLNAKGDRHFNGVVRCVPEDLAKPLGWTKPRRVFVNSMSDLFHPKVPFEFIDRVFGVMATTPRHTYQVLTKRPERMAEYFNARRRQVMEDVPATASTQWYIWTAIPPLGRAHTPIPWYWEGERIAGPWPLPNVWLGTSVSDQETADKAIPHLLRCPAAVRFVSYEPALGPVNFRPWLPGGWVCHKCGRVSCTPEPMADEGEASPVCACGAMEPQIEHRTIDWIIVGGESGTDAREFNVEWVYTLIRECGDQAVPVFVKQLGSKPFRATQFMATANWHTGDRKGGDPAEWPEDLRVREFPRAQRQEVAA